MIELQRPIVLHVPLDWEVRGTVVANKGGFWPFDTLETEERGDSKPGDIVSACCAEWFKQTDQIDELAASQGYDSRLTYLVKCMEPAAYYLSIPFASGGRYCEFHKPRVRPL